jgi:hypothetical protein
MLAAHDLAAAIHLEEGSGISRNAYLGLTQHAQALNAFGITDPFANVHQHFRSWLAECSTPFGITDPFASHLPTETPR